MGITYIVIRK